MVVERWAHVVDGVVHGVILWDGVVYHPQHATTAWTPPAEGTMVPLRNGDEEWVGPGHLHDGRKFSASAHWPNHLPRISPADGSVPGQLLIEHVDVPGWVRLHAEQVLATDDPAERRALIHGALKQGPH